MNSDNNTANYEMYRGNTKTWQFDFPYDITGHVLTFGMKECVEDLNFDAPVIITSTAGDHPGDDPAAGRMFLTIPSSISERLSPATYTYGFKKSIPASSVVLTILTGELEVKPDVTQN